jgi:hypothetical protein
VAIRFDKGNNENNDKKIETSHDTDSDDQHSQYTFAIAYESA